MNFSQIIKSYPLASIESIQSDSQNSINLTPSSKLIYISKKVEKMETFHPIKEIENIPETEEYVVHLAPQVNPFTPEFVESAQNGYFNRQRYRPMSLLEQLEILG